MDWALLSWGLRQSLASYGDLNQLSFLLSSIKGHFDIATFIDDCIDGLVGALKLSSIVLGLSSNSDRTKFLESQVATFGPAMRVGASKAAWTAIRTVLAFGGRRRNRNPICTQRLKSDGTRASTPQEIVDAMMQHFARIEGAKIMDPSMVAAQHSSLKPPSYDLVTRSITNVMPRRMLQASFCICISACAGLGRAFQ